MKFMLNCAAILTELAIILEFVASQTDVTQSYCLATPTDLSYPSPSDVDLVGDVHFCSCNLYTNYCDINCCCDTDCTTEDRTLFSQCADAGLSQNERSHLCQYTRRSYYDSNKTSVVTTINNPNLFCMWRDGNDQRDYYQSVELVTSNEAFTAAKERSVGSRSHFYDYSFATLSSSSTRYKEGQPIIAYSTQTSPDVADILKIPSSGGFSSSCIDRNPAVFLEDVKTSCVRNLNGYLSTKCENETSLNVAKLVDDILNLGILPHPTAELTNSLEVNVTGDFTTPFYDTEQNSCIGVLTGTDYIVKHTDGVIDSIDAVISVGNFDGTVQFVEQAFSVKFIRKKDEFSYTYHRSGNPGYVTGEPVIAGTRSGSVIKLNGDSLQYLTVVSSSADGSCLSDSANRLPVLFGENIRSGCLLKLTSSEIASQCSDTITLMMEALLGPTRTLNNDDSIYIASFGDSNELQLSDWVPLTSSSVPTLTNCNGLSMHLEILFAAMGSFANPQNRITGAKLYFDEIKYEFNCVGPYCTSHSAEKAQNFEIVSSVAFVDVSSPSETEYAVTPQIRDKLPADFFKPYYKQSSTV